MKGLAILLTALLSANVMRVGQEQLKPAKDDCGFTIQGEPTVASVTGPDDIVSLVHVLDQPDSPIEILSVDLEGMWLSVSKGGYTVHDCMKYQVRNRSNRAIQHFEIELGINGTGGFGVRNSEPILSGQTAEVKACNSGGHGSALEDSVKLLVSVHSIDFGNCMYRPSIRIPYSLGVYPGWMVADHATASSPENTTIPNAIRATNLPAGVYR